MNTQRLEKVLKKMETEGLEQMIISDPYAIYYLTGRFIDPGERLLALYINQSGKNKIFINKIFYSCIFLYFSIPNRCYNIIFKITFCDFYFTCCRFSISNKNFRCITEIWKFRSINWDYYLLSSNSCTLCCNTRCNSCS